AVTTTADCRQHPSGGRRSHDSLHIGNARTAGNQSRPASDHAVPNATGVGIPVVPRAQQVSLELALEFGVELCDGVSHAAFCRLQLISQMQSPRKHENTKLNQPTSLSYFRAFMAIDL